ncbi:nSTAND1 domain-containing NTPase [Sorangium sp. So ce406]|uniref:WD40 repeat domain-containing serine/threonine protein kinase n=1 Tax=Sorangium sp. So ce406 TaxID=3133311 RepID=UPI003F5BB411
MNRETLAPGMVFQSRYELLSLLRESSLGVVYAGRHIATGRPIVLKIFRLARDGDPADPAGAGRARFLRFQEEMRCCARLHHPNIARLVDWGQTDEGALYAVSELVPGQSLAEVLSQQGALAPQEARHLMRQVLDALACAHRQGIVHGALRPSHVIVVPSEARRDARVLDLGLASGARGGSAGAAASGTEALGLLYAAPEQLRGLPPTARSDLYAWGLVYLECLTGRRAGRESPLDGAPLQRESRGPVVRIPRALLGHPLGAILRQATIEDVDARIATADDLLRELDASEPGGIRRADLIELGAPSALERGAERSAGINAGLDADVSAGIGAQRGEIRSAGAPARPQPEPSLEGARPEDVETPQIRGAPEMRAPPPAPEEAPTTPAEPVAVYTPPDVGDTIKQYEIIRKLGQGGMGIVFLARDTRLGRLVAIKLLREHSGQGIGRFLAEARATARCRHENIVVIHEVDQIHGHPYLVLEYVKGRTLREWMAQREHPSAPGLPPVHTPPGPVAPSLAVELMIPVVRALICAHDLGIVHRDLKPENILLDDAGCIKVLDFGIAKQVEADVVSMFTGVRMALAGGAYQSGQSAILGTPRYMSPEQLRGWDIDARTDLWAVGIVLHELVTGAHPLDPFSAGRLVEIMNLDVPMPSASERRADVGALDALIDRCLKKRNAERIGSARELLAALEALLPGRKALDLGEDESPFAGLSAFQEADAPRFFGRDREAAALVTRLRNQQLVAVAGPSGAGKSSFVRAGVIPALKRSGNRWEAFILRPGPRPLSAIVDVLVQVAEAEPAGATGSPEIRDHDELVATLRAQPGYLGARLRARCRREGKRHRILLFVDQFEELYTLGAAPEDRAAFVACLQGAADDASSTLRAVLAIRSDFLDRIADDHHFVTEVTRGLTFLPPMGRDGLREALTRPIEAAGHRFETEAMIDHMLDTLEGTRSPLPLLQFTAAKLWEARDRERRVLTRDSYEQLGGVAGALSAHADAVLSALPLGEQRLARAVLLRLVTPERTRAVVRMEELRDLARDGQGEASQAIALVVQHLAGARLLLIETGDEREGATVELVHESLISRWTKLGQWLAESEQDAELLARLRAAAQQWEASGRAEGLLWRDRAAEDARTWYRRRREEQGAEWRAGLGSREEDYLLAVVDHCERARRLRRRLTTGVIAALAAIAVTVSYLAVRADQQATRADREAGRAQTEALRARNATRVAAARELQADPTSVLAILREVEPSDVPRGWAVLARWALYSRISRAVLVHPDGVMDADYSPDGRRIVTASWDKTARVWSADGIGEPLVLRGHEDRVQSAAFSPDGQRVVTASWDRTARVWSADGAGEPLVLRGHEDWVYAAAFSPDGQRIVTASADRTARVWSADGAGEPIVLRGHTDQIYDAAFSPDGKRIVTASWDRTARVWNADGTGEPLVLRGHDDRVYSAAFSPDGQRIVTASWDRTVRVWNADGTGEPLVLRGHDDRVFSAAFSPDNERIATGSQDETVRLWNADGSGEPVVLRGHDDQVYSVAFSPDGHHVVTASHDRAARVWNADDAGEPIVLRGHNDRIYGVAFSPDGRRVASASLDRTVRVWNADGTGEPIVLRGHEDEVNSVAFSPDGKRIASGSADKTVRVWNADGTGEPLVLRGSEDQVYSAVFSPDGQRIAVASWDRTVRVWNADGTGAPLVLRGHEDRVYSVAFSPDGKRILSGSSDSTARMWRADGAGKPTVFRGHDGAINAVAFSPDGRRIVTASWDRTARVWNADGTGEPFVFRGHEHWVLGVAFSPDGKRIATGSQDKTVRVWNADGTGEPLVLRASDSPVNAVAFSPDGHRIVTAADDKAVRVWTDLEELRGVDDPKLWAATTYCMPVERRMELLRVPEAAARASREACLRHVEAAREAAARP